MVDHTDVLDQLDRSAQAFTFPMLDNGYVFPVDTRLHVFRDDERWALVIEGVGYSPRGSNLYDVLYLYGNCITGKPGATNDDFLARIDNWDEIESDLRPEQWGDGANAVAVRGQRIRVGARPGEPLADVFRSLVPDHRELLLATEAELHARIPADVPRALRLEEWRHPDVVNGELPSETETFRQLAAVVETGDVSRYAPTEPPNTHWSNWPDGGSL